MDDYFIQHQENLIAQYMDLYPDADWQDAYEATAQNAYDTFGQYMEYLMEFEED